MLLSLKALYHLLVAVLATAWFGFPSRKLTVIGVTGTDGKTTTVTLIFEMLQAAGYRTSLISSVHAVIAGKQYDTGFHVTTPNAYWVQKLLREAADHGDTHFVLEVTSHALTQSRVWGIRFTVGVITNVTHEHLDWHKTYEAYLRTKLSLLLQSDTAVVNRDTPDVYQRARATGRGAKMITYGIHHPADVTPVTYTLQPKLPGEFNHYNCLAALATARALGVDEKKALAVVAGFGGVAGRLEVVVEHPFRVMVDFAHTPNAIEQVLRYVRSITKGRLIHVFGSAGLRDRSKRPKMGQASARYADVIILTEEDYRTEDVNAIIEQIAAGIPKTVPVQRQPDRGQAIALALASAKAGDTVILTGKGHEQSLCRGRKEYPWSDRAQVVKLLRRLV